MKRELMLAGTWGVLVLGAVVGLCATPASDVLIRVDHNSNDTASGHFKFDHVPSPSRDNAATKAALTLVDGEIDSNSANLGALTDGLLPGSEDEPESNFFFSAGSWGGRFRVDFGSAIEIAEVNTYSWHPNTRGPQVYKLYGADGAVPNFNSAPKGTIDPVAAGWHLIASVDTRPAHGDGGGQYGVSITDSSGSLGKYRYLLFSCFETEADDDFGNTFYSELNVIAKK